MLIIIPRLVVTVDFLQPVFLVDEDQENVSVCLTIDMPIATPLTVSVEATSLSADGKFVYTPFLPLKLLILVFYLLVHQSQFCFVLSWIIVLLVVVTY